MITKQISRKSEPQWTAQEVKFLQENINTLPLPDIAKALSKTENSVNIKAHRLRLERQRGGLLKENVARNYVQEMLTQRIGNPAYFRYTAEFRDSTGIGQKRFWALYRGEKNPTIDEYRAMAREFKVTLEDALDMQQLQLF